MRRLEDLNIDIFADGADLQTIATLAKDPLIKGFTTNPTLMRKAGVKDYEAWARQVLELVPDKPVSFEVLADDFDEMERQARKIASWGPNVFVKIPVMNGNGRSSRRLIRKLCPDIGLNITAVMTMEQVRDLSQDLVLGEPSYISVFAGRIADTGEDPFPFIETAVLLLPKRVCLIWASPREFLNIVQAAEAQCDVITVSPELLGKAGAFGKKAKAYSLETVQQFHRDAVEAGYTL